MEARKQKIVIWMIYLICGLFYADPALGKEDVYTTCPKYYKLYELNLINCTVSLSKVAQTSCSIPADDVQFYRSKNGVELSTCETVYNASSCEPARGGGKCGCVEHKGDQQVYQLQFVPTAADKSETFRCEVICSDAQNLQSGKHCPAISFGPPTTPPSDAGPPTTPPSSAARKHGRRILSWIDSVAMAAAVWAYLM